jgi:hypothetical protein
MMPVDPASGPAYQIPYDTAPSDPLPVDAGFERPVNPDGGDAGPLYLSPDADRWIQQNVTDFGYVIDWGTREIIDPNTGDVKGSVPTTFDRMI